MPAAPQTLRVVVDGGAPVAEELGVGRARATFADLVSRYGASAFIRLVGVKLWRVEGGLGAMTALEPAREGSAPAWPYLRGLYACEARVWTPAFSGAALTVDVRAPAPAGAALGLERLTVAVPVTPGMMGAELERAAAALIPTLLPGTRLGRSIVGGRAHTGLHPRRSLAEQDVHPGALLSVVSAPWRGQVSLKTLTGTRLEIGTKSSDTVLELKGKIQAKCGLPAGAQAIICGGRQLRDDRRLSEYGVDPSSALHLVNLIRGGMFHISSGRADLEAAATRCSRRCCPTARFSSCAARSTRRWPAINGTLWRQTRPTSAARRPSARARRSAPRSSARRATPRRCAR